MGQGLRHHCKHAPCICEEMLVELCLFILCATMCYPTWHEPVMLESQLDLSIAFGFKFGIPAGSVHSIKRSNKQLGPKHFVSSVPNTPVSETARAHAYTRVHTHTHAYTRTHTHTHTYTRIQMQTHAYTRIRMHKHAYTRIRTQTHAHTRTHAHAHTLTHTHTHTRAHTRSASVRHSANASDPLSKMWWQEIGK